MCVYMHMCELEVEQTMSTSYYKKSSVSSHVQYPTIGYLLLLVHLDNCMLQHQVYVYVRISLRQLTLQAVLAPLVG